MNPVKMNKVQQIVRMRQMLRKWRTRACRGASCPGKGAGRQTAVPAGYLAVYVGEERVRFLVKTAHLNHAIFRALLNRSQQEFGFRYAGPLSIPCEAVFFEHLLLLLDSSSPSSSPHHLQDLLDFYYSSYLPASTLDHPSCTNLSHHSSTSSLPLPQTAN